MRAEQEGIFCIEPNSLAQDGLVGGGVDGLVLVTPADAVILWNDPDTTLVHENGAGADILGGAVKRDDSANDTLYFKFHVDPLSDKDTEEYFAAFELFDGDAERLGIGNAMKAWAYSAFFHADETGESNNPAGYIDLHTLNPESSTERGFRFVSISTTRCRRHHCLQDSVCSRRRRFGYRLVESRLWSGRKRSLSAGRSDDAIQCQCEL